MSVSSFARCLIFVLAVGCLDAAAAGKTYALLVGVSDYPNLDRGMWLEGPRNDVQLFRDFLVERQVPRADITVLADGVDGAGLPDRRNILAAMQAIAGRAQSGDFVYLMFAGHGSQEPSKDSARDEPDGLDEIFMPRDIRGWDGENAAVPNAITDNELGASITAIRARGAFVWAVFDNCHSGTITRSASKIQGERDRQIKPEALGIPAAVLAAARSRAAAELGVRTRGGPVAEAAVLDRGVSGAATGEAGFVAFYAAQSQETTPEASLPLYSPDAVSRGLFSYTLYQVLTAHPDATYRQVIEQVLQIYQGMGKQNPTPTYEGTGLDNVVFGSTPGRRIAQWRLDKDNSHLRLRAGLVHQVTNDSILAVVPTPTAADTELLGYVKVTNAGTAQSDVLPVAYNNQPLLDVAALGAAAFARPVDLKVDFTLRVAEPAASSICSAPELLTSQTVAELKSSKVIARRVRWVAASEPADVRLCQRKSRGLMLLDGSGSLPADPGQWPPVLTLTTTAGLPPQGQLSLPAKQLGESLEKVGRVMNLARLGAGIGSATRLQVQMTWQRKCAAGARDCDGTPQELTPSTRPVVRDGDTILVKVTNPLNQPVDLTILYIDASYGITAMYPDAERGESPRLEPHAAIGIPLTMNANPSGFERMMLIGIPVTPQAPATSFVSLAQQGIAQTAKRGGGEGLSTLFEEAAFGGVGAGATRGAPGRAGATMGSAEIATFGWTVVP
jgi:hypothetical protein